MDQLRGAAKALGDHYYSSNSRSTRAMQLRKYLTFIDEFSGLLVPLPCPPSQVAIYIVWLSRTLKYSSITNYLSALNHFLKSEGSEPIDFSSHQIRTVLGGAKRTLGCAVKRAPPLLPTQLLRIFSFMSDSVGHVCTRAALILGFRALLRKCQLTSSESVLLRSDFAFHKWGMVVTIRRSKTIQFAERELLIPVARVHNRDLCAVHWVAKHFAQVIVANSEPAFQVPSGRGSYTPLDYATLQASIKYFAAKAGYSNENFSCHSLRRGGCTYLALQGATIDEIKVRGDWSSDVVYRYIARPLSERIIADMRVATALGGLG